ncbi:EndoU domain-containing protein [Streptomyces sp. NPDC002536]
MYGFATEDAAKADKTPWGTVDKREYTGVKWLWHHGTHVIGGLAEGFFKDGIWNTLTGLGHMVNVFDWKKFKETWHGIGLVGKGIAMYGVEPLERAMNPMGGPYAPNPDHERAKKAAREFGKSLLAWDQWKKNPGRAIGTVAFNGITLGMGPLLKLGKAGELGNMGKAGEAGSNVAKVAGALGRAGQLVDPMTYIGGAAKYAKVQVGELLTSLKETRTGPTGDFLNGASKHPGALVGTPDGIKYIDHEGRPRTLTDDGKILDEHGDLAEPPARKEPHKHDLTSTHETSPSEPRVLAHAGGSHPQASMHTGEGPSQAGHDAHSPSQGGEHHSGPQDPHGHTAHHPADSTGHAHADFGSPGGGEPPSAHHDEHRPGDGDEVPGPKPSGHIPEHAMEHVLRGELKYSRDGRPKVVGYHFRPGGRDRWGVKVPKILKIDHRTGLTQGNVWMRDPRSGEWIMKRAKTTFFPNHWTEGEVRRAMVKAFENAKVMDPDICMWQGEYKGITFEGYFDPVTGDAKTVYPILPQ